MKKEFNGLELFIMCIVGLWNTAYLVLLWIPLALGYQSAEYAEPNQGVAIIEIIVMISGVALFANGIRKLWNNRPQGGLKKRTKINGKVLPIPIELE